MLAAKRALLAVLILVASSLAAAAQYALQPGDTVRVEAAGVADFQPSATIDVDGNLTAPLVGTFQASGMTLADVRDEIARRLSASVLNRRLITGEEIGTVIEPHEVGVTIDEYRPVYVDGDVTRPGEQAYRPQMTVRQAIANAGGVSVVRGRDEEPSAELARLQGEFQNLQVRLAKRLVEEARLIAELDGRREFDAPPLEGSVEPGFVDRLVELEGDFIEARAERLEGDKASLGRAIAKVEERLEFLRARRVKEERAAAADAKFEETVRQSFQRGLIPINRVAEAERLALASAARVQEVSASIAQTAKEIEEMMRARNQLDESRRVDLVEATAAAATEIAQMRGRMRALAEEMLSAGAAPSALFNRNRDTSVTVHRSADGAGAIIDAALDAALLPGDVVDVELVPFGPASGY
ncbi:polysaccharide biosynthesis/export family protein [Acuticoccus sp.]|uniref:polysaccharide biosynthesis/export family protein n=1 Tax=Acuticoccus sp. TaxID=1904378 RepID=UPI003B51B64E